MALGRKRTGLVLSGGADREILLAVLFSRVRGPGSLPGSAAVSRQTNHRPGEG